jgi:hypothetical protein
MKTCGYCGRENHDRAAHCSDCGTALLTEPENSQTANLQDPDDPWRAAAEKQIRSGALWCVGGSVVTVVTYLSALNNPFGGTYIFAWGAILFGLLRFYQGISNKNKKPNNEDIGYAAVAYAAKLETLGNIDEALSLYQSVIEKFPNTDASNDAKKSIENLHAKRSQS